MGKSELAYTCSSGRDSGMFLERPSDVISRLRAAVTSAALVCLQFLR